jgi:hypothetical protein
MVTNQELEKVFECDHLVCPTKNLNELIRKSIREELPKLIPLDELDDVQWDYIYGQIKIMVADALQMKNEYLKDRQ